MGNKDVNRLVQNGLLPEARIETEDHLQTSISLHAFTRSRSHQRQQRHAGQGVDRWISPFCCWSSRARTAPEEVFETRQYGSITQGTPRHFVSMKSTGRQPKVRCLEDQLHDPVKLMLRQPATQRYVQNRVDHLIVDEAQDMNGIQIALLKILAGDRAKVMLVGDEDQAIYDWRGAEPDYLIQL